MLEGSPAWTPGAGTGGTIVGTAIAAWHFITSSVAMTLYLDGLYLLPPFAALMFLWHRQSLSQRGRSVTFWRDGSIMLASYLVAVFVVSLGAAIFSAVVVNYIGALIGVGDHIARGLGEIPANTPEHVGSYLIGLPIALAILWFTVLQPGGLVNRLLTPWCLDRAAPEGPHN